MQEVVVIVSLLVICVVFARAVAAIIGCIFGFFILLAEALQEGKKDKPPKP